MNIMAEKLTGVERSNRYMQSILEKTKLSNKYIYALCVRQQSWLSKTDRIFNIDKVNKIIKVIEKYLVTNDGANIYLYDFQCWIIGQIYGWEYTNSKRICSKALVMMARGGGKSFLCALMAFIDMLFPDPNDKNAPNTVIGAPTKKVAGEVYDQFKKMLEKSPISDHFDLPRSNYKHQGITKFKQTGAICSTTSADSKNDGDNISLAVIDEVHYLKDSELMQALEYSFVKRENPLLIMITTAGSELEGPLKQYHDCYKDDLVNEKLDDDVFPVLYVLDDEDYKTWDESLEGDDITKRLVNKVQPLYDLPGQEKMVERYDKELRDAKKFSIGVDEFKTKKLNMFVTNSEEIWIDNSVIKSVMKDVEWESMRGWKAWIGVDLSSVSDLTAVSWCFYNYDEDKYVFKTLSYVPSESIKDRNNIDMWKRFVNRGELNLTDGKTVNYGVIVNDMDRINTEYGIDVQCVLYDQWNSNHFIGMLEDLGYECVKHGQSNAAFNPPSRELERLLLGEETDIIIDKSGVTALCFNNVIMDVNQSNLAKPKRKHPRFKIDNVIAMLQGLGGLLFDIKNGNVGGDLDIFSITY